MGIYVGTVAPSLVTYAVWNSSRVGYWAWIDISQEPQGDGFGTISGVSAITSVAQWTAAGIAPDGVAELVSALATTSVSEWNGNGGLPLGVADLIGVSTATSVADLTGTGAAAQGVATLTGATVTTSVGTFTGAGEIAAMKAMVFGQWQDFTHVGSTTDVNVDAANDSVDIIGQSPAIDNLASYIETSFAPSGNWFLQFDVAYPTFQTETDKSYGFLLNSYIEREGAGNSSEIPVISMLYRYETGAYGSFYAQYLQYYLVDNTSPISIGLLGNSIDINGKTIRIEVDATNSKTYFYIDDVLSNSTSDSQDLVEFGDFTNLMIGPSHSNIGSNTYNPVTISNVSAGNL